MAKIIQLDRHTADLIAAGEVVERPASVIKELMENSIDAGARNITVEIESGGMTYMRVTDDGSGISSEDVETAFLRHATSKLRDKRGLESIATLGFRGEALAAISAVSKIELITCAVGENEGRKVLSEGGNIISNTAVGAPEGTTMIVRDLFYNTPARHKFMKTDRAEGSAVTGVVVKAALSHPEVSVKYIKDGKTELHTPGDTKLDSCIYSVFGRDFANSLIPAFSDDGVVKVTGYVSAPSGARGNRGSQFFFVNGRNIKSRTLQAALEQAYRNSLFTGKFPACVLYIEVSCASVDVNVHPTKTEVKFSNEKAVFDGVYYAALGALEKDKNGESAPVKKAELPVSKPSFTPAPKPATPPTATKKPDAQFYKTMTSDTFKSSYGGGSGFKTSITPAPPIKKESVLRDATVPTYKSEKPKQETFFTPPVKKEEPMEEAVISAMPKEKEHRIIGETLNTYIIVEKGDSVWFIDKHAAHERIHFDRLKAQTKEIMVQPLLLPVVCRLGAEDVQVILDNTDILEKYGFAADAFGKDSIAVRQLPSHIDQKDVESVISDICTALKNGGESGIDSGTDEILHTIACKAAIKAGKMSTLSELEGLVDRVMSGEIRYCPHGRPVAVEFTKGALDKSFKRT
ncbi:MAG: DNA mismatch repair endonuclease MutL [Oscillospiraceae bacterium]|nr:DNA mismatch repair endonuclease MutL [Oscillospiraceae bacterium]